MNLSRIFKHHSLCHVDSNPERPALLGIGLPAKFYLDGQLCMELETRVVGEVGLILRRSAMKNIFVEILRSEGET